MEVSPPPPSSSSSPSLQETKPENSDSEKPHLQSNQPDPSSLPPPATTSSSSSPSPSASSVITENPNSNSSMLATHQQAPPSLIQSFTPSTISPGTLPPTAPSFRPVPQMMMTMSTPHFSPLPNPNLQNPNFQNPNVQPPGVSIMLPGAGSVNVSVSPLRPGGGMYQQQQQQPMHPSARPYGQIPNGYAMPPPAPQGTLPPPVS